MQSEALVLDPKRVAFIRPDDLFLFSVCPSTRGQPSTKDYSVPLPFTVLPRIRAFFDLLHQNPGSCAMTRQWCAFPVFCLSVKSVPDPVIPCAA